MKLKQFLDELENIQKISNEGLEIKFDFGNMCPLLIYYNSISRYVEIEYPITDSIQNCLSPRKISDITNLIKCNIDIKYYNKKVIVHNIYDKYYCDVQVSHIIQDNIVIIKTTYGGQYDFRPASSKSI